MREIYEYCPKCLATACLEMPLRVPLRNAYVNLRAVGTLRAPLRKTYVNLRAQKHASGYRGGNSNTGVFGQSSYIII